MNLLIGSYDSDDDAAPQPLKRPPEVEQKEPEPTPLVPVPWQSPSGSAPWCHDLWTWSTMTWTANAAEFMMFMNYTVYIKFIQIYHVVHLC